VGPRTSGRAKNLVPTGIRSRTASPYSVAIPTELPGPQKCTTPASKVGGTVNVRTKFSVPVYMIRGLKIKIVEMRRAIILTESLQLTQLM